MINEQKNNRKRRTFKAARGVALVAFKRHLGCLIAKHLLERRVWWKSAQINLKLSALSIEQK
jgi:hypothetical protein